MIDRESLVVRREGWLSAKIQADLVMMSAESNNYLSLNGCGEHIWELLAAPRRVNEICRLLASQYEVDPGAAEPEVLAFLEQLRVQKAIDVVPTATA